MRYFILTLLMVVSGVIAAPVFAGDMSYRDPRQPSFTLLVPDGWSSSKSDTGVNLARGNSWVQLGVLGAPVQPGAMMVQMRPQFERQYKNFKELGSGEVTFGGQKGAYAIYGGIPPSGVSGVTKVVTMTNGRMTYTLFMGAHADEYARVKGDMDRIQASFVPDPLK